MNEGQNHTQPNLPSAQVELEIPFHDVDAMNVVWHGHYAKYFEIARCQLLDSIDYNYVQMRDSNFAWPVINLQVKYVRAIAFQQKIVVHAQLLEWEHRLRVRYKITDASTGAKLTTGFTDQVAVDMSTQEMQLVSPPILAHKLGLD